MYALNIFDTKGLPSMEIPDSEIAKLDAEQKAAFFQLMASYSETVEADAETIECEKAQRRAVTDLKRKMEAHEKLMPKHTFFDEWKRTIAKQPPAKPDPDLTKKLKASMANVDKAHEHLAGCERAIVVSKQVRQTKRKTFGLALIAWSKVDGTPKSTADLVKARAKTEQTQQLANIAAGLPPEYAEARQSTVGDSHLDRFKSGGGRGHSANFGYHRNKLRGAQLRVPSEG
jgi:hypothetical protein